jgi:hypothetical protein
MDAGTELVGFGLVLESPAHGPQFCLGAIFLSDPPQCGGPPIPNWDWSAVSGHTSRNGATWGDYTLVGTYDGHVFTITRPPQPGRGPGGDPAADELDEVRGTPCPEPPGGWRVVDPSKTTDESMERAFEDARGLEGYAGLWLDQSINPAASRADEDAYDLMNDPEKLIINVAVTGDTAAAEARLREVWGGALCVSRARHTDAELRWVQEEVARTPGVLSVGTTIDRVNLEVIHDDGTLQRELDATYGAGLVVVASVLRPYAG